MSLADTPTRDAIEARLESVRDPELDESIVDLGYVDGIDTDDGLATVRFTLPTAWCSPAFAWMMAVDAREAVESLPGVERARIVLREHVHEREITDGVNAGVSFEEAFPDADGGIEDVRATLEEKARLARQYDAVEALLEAGLSERQVVEVTRDDLDLEHDDRAGIAAITLEDAGVIVPADAEPLGEYLVRALEGGLASDPGEPLVRDPDGEPIRADDLEGVHRRARLAKVNMTGQGEVCEALNRARRAKLGRATADGS